MSMKTRGAIALIGGALLLSLAGCTATDTPADPGGAVGSTGGAGASGQQSGASVEESCDSFVTQVGTFNAKQGTLENVTDMTAEVLIQQQQDTVDEVVRVGKATGNAEVKSAILEMADISQKTIPLMEKAMANPDSVSELTESSEFINLRNDNEAAVAKFENLCPGALTKVTTSTFDE